MVRLLYPSPSGRMLSLLTVLLVACNTKISGQAVIQLFRTALTVAVPCECAVVSICGNSTWPEVDEGATHSHQVKASAANTARAVALLLGLLCALVALI